MKFIFLLILFNGLFVCKRTLAQVSSLNEYRAFAKELRLKRIAMYDNRYQSAAIYNARIKFNVYLISNYNMNNYASSQTRRTYVESPKPNSLNLDRVSYYMNREGKMDSPLINQVIAPIFYESIKVIGELNSKQSR